MLRLASYKQVHLAFLLVITLFSASCNQASQPQAQPIVLTVADDPAALIAALPSQIDTPTAPPQALQAEQTAWAQPVAAWMRIGLEAVKRDGMSPPRAARALALLAVGMDKTLQVTQVARAQGHKVSEQAALAAVAVPILNATHPLLVDLHLAEEQASIATWIDVWQGQADAASVGSGQAIGQAVAEQMLAYAQADRSGSIPAFEVPDVDPATGMLTAVEPGFWQPTPRHYMPGLEPEWGQVQPMLLTSGAAVRAAAPPAWESQEFAATRAEFAAMNRNLSDADRELARYWAYGGGTVTPVGAWYERALALAERDRLDSRATARMLMVLGITLNDAVIACWESKYHYRVARPIQWMQQDSQLWLPLLETPPHPSYPSGHSVISAAAMVVLGKFFPNDAAQLEADARAASRSRVLGGIHWPIDTAAGFVQGQQVAALVLKSFETAK